MTTSDSRARTWRLFCGVALVSSVTGCGPFRDTAPTEWLLSEAPAGDTLLLRVAVGLPCNELQPVEVIEEPSKVTIRTSVVLADDDVACPAAFAVEEMEVTLEEPLGDRELRGCAPDQEDAIQFVRDESRADPDCLASSNRKFLGMQRASE